MIAGNLELAEMIQNYKPEDIGKEAEMCEELMRTKHSIIAIIGKKGQFAVCFYVSLDLNYANLFCQSINFN